MLPEGVVRGSKNPLYLGLAKRLKALRKDADVSVLALAEGAGIYASHVAYILDGSRAPRLDTVEKLSRALKVSPCWLAFGQKGPLSESAELLSETLPSRLIEAREQAGHSRKELGRLSETSDTAVRKVESGESCPTLATIERFAAVLEVTPCWLAFGVGPMERPARRAARRDASVQP